MSAPRLLVTESDIEAARILIEGTDIDARHSALLAQCFAAAVAGCSGRLASALGARDHLLRVVGAVNAITQKGNHEGTRKSVERVICESRVAGAVGERDLADALLPYVAHCEECDCHECGPDTCSCGLDAVIAKYRSSRRVIEKAARRAAARVEVA